MWFWYGFGMVSICFWYGLGMVLVCFGMVVIWFGMVLVLFWYGFGMVLTFPDGSNPLLLPSPFIFLHVLRWRACFLSIPFILLQISLNSIQH